MKNRISISVLTGTFFLLLLALSVSAQPFKANERVAFIGDSITHGGSYHTLIQTFYATRYPELNILCFNVGISGDNAQGGYQRASLDGEGIWESDVRMYRPTTATIMLGMNDVGGDQFNSAQTIEALNAANKKQLVWYQANYAQLLENLVKLGISDPILITPSPYDQTMVNEKARANLYKFGQGKNDLIRILYKDAITLEANKRDLQVIDFNTPMLAINAEIQAKAPDASIIGTDRVHPGPDGHMVMAYLFLKAQELEGPVASLELDAPSSSVESTYNCSIQKLHSIGNGLSFEYSASSLPFPTAPYRNIATLIPFERTFNQESLVVKGLSPDTYSLQIDGLECGQFTAEELEVGINLALLERAPQVQQSNQVYALSQQRAKLAAKIRTVVWTIGYLSKIKGHNANDVHENQAIIKRLLTGEHPEGLWSAPSNYVKSNLRQYLENFDAYVTMLKDLEATSESLYAAAKPHVHTVQIIRVQ